MSSLDNKVAVITGASSGLGFEIAKKYHSAGAKVALCDINFEKAEEAVKKLGLNAIAVEMDVSSEDAVNAGIDSVAEKCGTIRHNVAQCGTTWPNAAMWNNKEKRCTVQHISTLRNTDN